MRTAKTENRSTDRGTTETIHWIPLKSQGGFGMAIYSDDTSSDRLIHLRSGAVGLFYTISEVWEYLDSITGDDPDPIPASESLDELFEFEEVPDHEIQS